MEYLLLSGICGEGAQQIAHAAILIIIFDIDSKFILLAVNILIGKGAFGIQLLQMNINIFLPRLDFRGGFFLAGVLWLAEGDAVGLHLWRKN